MGYKFINTCSQCQCPMEVDSDWIGQNIQCPRCGNAFTVNAPQMQQAPVPPQMQQMPQAPVPPQAPQLQQMPQAPVPPQMQFPPPEQQNKSTASLVLGILGLVFCGGIGSILSLVGLIIGCQKKYKTGIILGAIGIAINIIMVIVLICALLLPALNTARERARSSNCMSNLKHIGLGIAMYADSNKSYTPSGKGKESLDLLLDGGYLPDSFKFKCPSSKRSESYAYIGEKLIMGRDDPGLPVVLDYAGNHKNTVNVLHLGGHVSTVQVPGYCTTVEDVAKHVMEKECMSWACSDSHAYSRKCSYCQVLENARQY